MTNKSVHRHVYHWRSYIGTLFYNEILLIKKETPVYANGILGEQNNQSFKLQSSSTFFFFFWIDNKSFIYEKNNVLQSSSK